MISRVCLLDGQTDTQTHNSQCFYA